MMTVTSYTTEKLFFWKDQVPEDDTRFTEENESRQHVHVQRQQK